MLTGIFFTDGTKEKVIVDANDLSSIEVYDSKIYYFDATNNLKVYDIETKKSITYEFEGVEVHANTFLLSGKDYTIISYVDVFIKNDMESKKYQALSISTNNYSMFFDDDENIFYFF